MDSSEVLATSSVSIFPEPDPVNISKSDDEFKRLREQVISNFQKQNVPNINVPERIIICMDLCYDDNNSVYRLGDGTTFSPINMFKRLMDFFLHSKYAINKDTEYALMVLKDSEACWLQNFTNNLKDIVHVINFLNPEESTTENVDFRNIFELIKQNVEMPEIKEGDNIMPPPYVVRLIVLYGRSLAIPIIPSDDVYFNFIKKHLYFYIDILFSHEEDCALYRCEEVYDALQDLDNGYSYVFEVSKNATKIHDCIAKLLAHPLQRALQKNTDYSFGNRS